MTLILKLADWFLDKKFIFDALIGISRRTRLKLFRIQITFGIWILNTFGNKVYAAKLQKLIEQSPEESIGHEIHLFFKKYQLAFVPHYEHHDFKHVILEFDSEPEDEMRMQAFMFGNSGFSFTAVIIYAMFVFYTPEMWFEIPYYYRMGKRCNNLSDFTPEELCSKNLKEFRTYMQLEPAKQSLQHYQKYESRNMLYLLFDWRVV
ncbi:MAG: hypothetical protein HYZ42_16730 [Bacteroidetes bacterium]|nr:hypothetical protein [Bacteroidota bacterium]